MKMEHEDDMSKVVVAMLSSAVNIMGGDSDETAVGLFEAITHDHRTLQQQMVAVLTGVLYHYAEASSDGRNEAAVRMCQMIARVLEDAYYVIDGKVRLPVI